MNNQLFYCFTYTLHARGSICLFLNPIVELLLFCLQLEKNGTLAWVGTTKLYFCIRFNALTVFRNLQSGFWRYGNVTLSMRLRFCIHLVPFVTMHDWPHAWNAWALKACGLTQFKSRCLRCPVFVIITILDFIFYVGLVVIYVICVCCA
jgi:hypothetical protein